MKTKIKGLLAILIGLFMFSSVAIKAAPCPKIINRTQCSFKIIVTEYKQDPVTGLCNIVCNSYSTLVPPGASIPVQCICGGCNISIQVVGINGMPIPTVTVDYTSGTQTLPANPCGASGVLYDASIPAFVFF